MKTKNSQETAIALHEALKSLDLSTVPVVCTDRHIARKDQAKLARDLFKSLGLKGISVTTPNYSMASVCYVNVPSRKDFTYEGSSSYVAENCPTVKANSEATAKIELILDKAFPKHDNRSDSQTDYFDAKWSFNRI